MNILYYIKSMIIYFPNLVHCHVTRVTLNWFNYPKRQKLKTLLFLLSDKNISSIKTNTKNRTAVRYRRTRIAKQHPSYVYPSWMQSNTATSNGWMQLVAATINNWMAYLYIIKSMTIVSLHHIIIIIIHQSFANVQYSESYRK